MVLQKERKSILFSSRFDLSALDDYECLRRFRFLNHDIGNIVTLLGWDNQSFVTRRRGYTYSGIEMFCILSRRMSTPCVWKDLEREFFRCSSALCEIFYESLEYLYTQRGHLVEEFKYSFLVSRAINYAVKVYSSGAPLGSCVGFVDGTDIYIARPRGSMQRESYNGHKKGTA